MTDVKIREVSPQDAHEVWRLHDIAYNSTGHFFTMDHQEYNATPQSTKRWIRRVIISDADVGLVATIDGKVVGTIFVEESKQRKLQGVVEVTMITVDPEHRGKSIGLMLGCNAYMRVLENPGVRKGYVRIVESNTYISQVIEKTCQSLGIDSQVEGRFIDYLGNPDGTFSNVIFISIDLRGDQ